MSREPEIFKMSREHLALQKKWESQLMEENMCKQDRYKM
jgi:hypothetical protein